MDQLSDFLLNQILRTDENNCVLNLEDNEVEYKIRFDWSDRATKQKCVKELAALSNARGGYLIYGIDDNTGEIVGESKTEDLANIIDAFNRQFSPSIQLKGRTFVKDEIPVFVLHASPSHQLPSICIKEFDGVRDGIILYRYASKSEPIKGVDLISTLQFLQKDTATEKLIDTQQENRRKDLMPKLHLSGSTSGGSGPFTISFINNGNTARIFDVVSHKKVNSSVSIHLGSNRNLEKGKSITVGGSYKNQVSYEIERTFGFRIYFEDQDENLYFVEFKGYSVKAENNQPKPIETSLEEMEQFKAEQKE